MNRLPNIPLVAILILIIIIGTITGIYIHLNSMLVDVKGNARAPARAVLVNAQIADITGDYWENELFKQAKLVANLPLEERLDFYRAILTYRDLETSKAMVFAEIVNADATPLLRNLIALQNSDKFLTFSPREQKRIREWVDELRIITTVRRVR